MRTFALIVLLAAVSGCAGARSLDRALAGRRWTVPYSAGAEVVAEKDGPPLRLAAVTVSGKLPATTTVKVFERFYLPLIVFNYLAETWRYDLGEAQLGESPDAFIRSTLVEELRRGSRRPLVSTPAGTELEVTVTRMEVSQTSRYEVWIAAGPPGAVVGENRRDVRPAVARLEAEILLRDEAGAVVRREVEGSSEVEVAREVQGHPDLERLPPALVEAFARAVRNLNLAILRAVDAAPAGRPVDGSGD